MKNECNNYHIVYRDSWFDRLCMRFPRKARIIDKLIRQCVEIFDYATDARDNNRLSFVKFKTSNAVIIIEKHPLELLY